MDFSDEYDHYEDELHEIRPYMYSTTPVYRFKKSQLDKTPFPKMAGKSPKMFVIRLFIIYINYCIFCK